MFKRNRKDAVTASQECPDSIEDNKEAGVITGESEVSDEAAAANKEGLTGLSLKGFWIPVLTKCAIIIGVHGLLFGALFHLNILDGPSMEPTLHNHTILLTNHIAPKIEHGTIVVCNPENLDYQVIKRVIGMPGDIIEISSENQCVYRNGIPLEEDYIYPAYHMNYKDYGPVKIEEGTYFVMGDNRNSSMDSRNPLVGVIKESEIDGSYLFTIIP